MFPNIFSSIMTDSDKTGYFHSAANEAMKPIFFLLIVFTGLESFNSPSTLSRMGGGGKCKKVPC